MKIVYVNNFLEQSGWSEAGRGLIKSMSAVGLDVVPRNISMGQTPAEPDEEIKELMQRSAAHPDILVQHTLPHFFDYNGAVARNIGVYTSETSNFKYTSWPFYINTMDEVWVANEQSKTASLASGVATAIHVVPYAVDVSKFNRSYTPLKFRDEHPDSFIFYQIAEFNTRKNYGDLLKAFHLEFDPAEPMELILKTTQAGGVKGKEVVREFCNNLKSNLRIYPNLSDYKEEVIVCEDWSEENINRLHYSADCFVTASRGESWGYGCFDAMGFGKTPICPNHTGFPAYMTDNVGWLIESEESPVIGYQSGIDNLFTARENWASPNIGMLRRSMREAYSNKELRIKKAKAARLRAFDFSYEKVGQQIKEILEKQ